VTPPGLYRHYKGGLYRVLFTVQDSTNGRDEAPMVCYVALEGDHAGNICVRDEAEFNGVMDFHARPQMLRFTWVKA